MLEHRYREQRLGIVREGDRCLTPRLLLLTRDRGIPRVTTKTGRLHASIVDGIHGEAADTPHDEGAVDYIQAVSRSAADRGRNARTRRLIILDRGSRCSS